LFSEFQVDCVSVLAPLLKALLVVGKVGEHFGVMVFA
jgi:hypothetical protein